MGLFNRFFGRTEGRNDQERRNQQDAAGNSPQPFQEQGAQCDSESLRTAEDLTARAKQLRTQVCFDEAEPLFRQSLAILEGACGPNHWRVASALCDLASVLQHYDAVEPLYRRSLAITEGVFGPDHPNSVIPLHGMAVALEVESRYQEAEPLYRRCLEIGEAVFGPDDPKVASILQRIAATLRSQSRYEEAESLYRRSLAIMEGVFGPDHPDVARTRRELEALLNKSHRTGMLRREGGKKYLRIDGAHAVVQACSTAENYLDRCLTGGVMFGDGDLDIGELRWFQDGTIGTSDFVRVGMQECCHCGASFQIPMRFPNTSVEVECPHCGKGQVFYVVQMSAGFEQALGMENRLGSGYSVIWLTVPSRHPEFSALLAQHGMVTWRAAQSEDTGAQFVNIWQDVRWFEGPNGEAWWPGYREILSGLEILVLPATTTPEANETAVRYEVSSFEPQEHLDVDGHYVAGRDHCGTRVVSAGPSELAQLDDFPRSQVWDRRKAADFINRSAENNYQLSEGRYVPEAYSTMLHIVEGADFRFAVYKEGVVELWTEVPSTQPPSGKSVTASEDWPSDEDPADAAIVANQATAHDNYCLSVAGGDGRPNDAQHFMLLQFWMAPTLSREDLLRVLETADANSFDFELGNAAIDGLLASGHLHALENHEFSITELGLQECIRWNLEYDLLISKPSGMLDYTVDMVQYLVSEREPRISEEALSRILAPYIDKYTALYNRNR